jgi:CheY-like chemotaxis protein
MTFADATAPADPSFPHAPLRAPGGHRKRRLAGEALCPPRAAPEQASNGCGHTTAATPPAILVVDDDADIRDSLSFLLEGEGYEVHTAADGRQALALLERIARPALALVDLRMPVMDGVELIEAMRKDPRWARLPVVAFSAASTIAVPEDVLLLHKPIGVKLLLATVEQRRAV